jgi:glycosyltransferase involved in cell wall biosynthesis
VRIALVSTPFVAVPPHGYGGTELVVHELERGLTALGHEVSLFATGNSLGKDVRSLFLRPVWPPDPAKELEHCRWATGAIAAEHFDVVHAHTPALLRFAGALGTPLVYTIHHAHEDRLTKIYRSHPEVRYVAISTRQAALDADLHCEVVHHGLDAARYRLGQGVGGYAAFLGRLAPAKAPELAIAAAEQAGVPIKLAGEFHAIDGDPAWEAKLRRALTSPAVTELGEVRGERKGRLLRDARALLMPVMWEEPFGLVMLEAMLCGTPVVAFPRGAVPEVVDQGVTGFLVKSTEEMAEALSSLDGFDRAACRRRAEQRFSASRMVSGYERVYATVTHLGAGEATYAG